MDTPGNGYYKCDDSICRADRWRLLHDVGSTSYDSTPLSSWQLIGRMPLSAVEVDVMAHVGCKRHEKHYARWEWFGRDGINILDARRISNHSIIDPVTILLTKFAAALRSILAWLIDRGEKSEYKVFDHSLTAGLISSGVNPRSFSNAVKVTEELLFPEPYTDQRASIAATRSIFVGLTIGGEGWGERE